MYKTPSPLPEAVRMDLARSLDDRLADGLDLHSQIKVAHWNIRGPQFPSLHPLFEQFAIQLATHNDAIAERAVTLGGVAHGTARHVAKVSRIAEYPSETPKDLDHVRALAERIDTYLAGARQTRDLADASGDSATTDLLNLIVSDFEKNAWFLRATLA